MFLKKVLNQPNLVGTVMIALLFCAGFVYAFAFDGFNVETTTGGEVEAWLAAADGGSSGQSGKKACKCSYKSVNRCKCKSSKSDKDPCNGAWAHGCQDKCAKNNRCQTQGGCIWEWYISHMKTKPKMIGTRCERHQNPDDYCDQRTKGGKKGT